MNFQIQPRRRPQNQPPAIDPRDIKQRFQIRARAGTPRAIDDQPASVIPPRIRPDAGAQPQDSLDTPGEEVASSDANELLTISEREKRGHAAGLPTLVVNRDGVVKVSEPPTSVPSYQIQSGAERAAMMKSRPADPNAVLQPESAMVSASAPQRSIAPRPSPFAAQTGTEAQQDAQQQAAAPSSNQLAPTATPEELERLGAEQGSMTANNIELSPEPASWPQFEIEPRTRAASSDNAAATPPAPRSFSDDIRAQLDRIIEMQRTPATDKNGGFKSTLKSFLYALGPSMEAASQRAAARGQRVDWGDFFTGLAGAGGAGLAGLIDKSADERHAQQWEIKREIDDLGRKVQTHRALIDIEADEARAAKDRATAAAQPGKRDASERKAKFAELGQRLKVMGGKYFPDRDPRLDALVNELGVSPKEGGGSHFNPQGLKTVGDELTYTELSNGRPVTVVLHSAAMSDSDKVRNAIALGQLNNSRARLNLPPLEINPELLGEIPDQQQSAPAQSPPATPAGAPANTSQSQPAPASSPAPASGSRPVLVPTGEKATPVPRGRGRRGSRSSNQRGASSSGGARADREASIVVSQINSANARAVAAENRARDAEYRGEGAERVAAERREAAANRQAAEEARKQARSRLGRSIQLNVDGSATLRANPPRQESERTRPKLKLPVDLVQPSH